MRVIVFFFLMLPIGVSAQVVGSLAGTMGMGEELLGMGDQAVYGLESVLGMAGDRVEIGEELLGMGDQAVYGSEGVLERTGNRGEMSDKAVAGLEGVLGMAGNRVEIGEGAVEVAGNRVEMGDKALGMGEEAVVSLAGVWRFAMDREDVGEKEEWFRRVLEDSIVLPGSMAERGKGVPVSAETRWTASLYDSTFYYSPAMERYRKAGAVKVPFFLTPVLHYVGAAWYQREVVVPEEWKEKAICLALERVHVESCVWVGEVKVSKAQYSLSTPHVYDLTGLLKAGERQRITIRVENRVKEEYDVGKDSHSLTDHTQGNWNGVVGKMELRAKAAVHIKHIDVFPQVKAKAALVKVEVANGTGRPAEARLALGAESYNSTQEHRTEAVERVFMAKPGIQVLELRVEMGEGMLTWDEFVPALYRLKATLTVGGVREAEEVSFGMREMGVEGKYLTINGRRIMLRGTVENCVFPLTGYPPMGVAEWRKVFGVCRNYGLNHVRLHSYCPPEAAFVAADLAGIYLQVEGPSWPNHGVALGRGMAVDTFLMQETEAMSRRFGNHASFCFLACGNEPAGDWVPWVGKFVDYWAEADRRRVYTGASVGGSWAWQPKSEYHVKAGARGLDWGAKPETMSDFGSRIDTVGRPYVAHEMGQWCAFPGLAEVGKYGGVYRAYNFEIFGELLAENGMGELAEMFQLASGKLQLLCYKHEIEKTLRTPGYAGFQLLALNDYPGQGTAVVGVVDALWEKKPYAEAVEFRKFCNETVPLTRMKGFVFKNSEEFAAEVEVFHFGKADLAQGMVEWAITNEEGVVVAKGAFAPRVIPTGGCRKIGTVRASLGMVKQASALRLEVKIAGTGFVNDWKFWVYPEGENLDKGKVLVTDSLDEEAIGRLKAGGEVLVLAAGKVNYGKEIRQWWTPVFWNSSWFRMRPPHTTGLLVEEGHPAFGRFPTQFHSDLQWAELVHGAQVMLLSDFPLGFRPLVQNIDTYHMSRKAGSLFEARVGMGKLMMTSLDLGKDLENRPVARQLLASILAYMNSESFEPAAEVAVERIIDLFVKEEGRKSYITKN